MIALLILSVFKLSFGWPKIRTSVAYKWQYLIVFYTNVQHFLQNTYTLFTVILQSSFFKLVLFKTTNEKLFA